jgi:hypothetical protein
MARDVTLRATASDLVGDETYELWLKHETDAWFLEASGVLSVDIDNQEDFLLSTLVEGAHYVAQMRLKRAGRYRAGYLTSDPDTWPSESRVEFIPGALEGVDAPVMNSATWSRTSSIATRVTISINAADVTKDIKVYRDGGYIATISQPHTNPITFIDNNPALAVNHAYTAKHTVGFLDGPESTPVECFAGPLPPSAFVRTSPDSQYGKYDLSWSAGGDDVQVQDDFLCVDVFSNQISGPGTTTASVLTVFKELTLSPPGATQTADFHARGRRYTTSFTVTDVSDWAVAEIIMLIDDPNADYNSCP